MKYFLNSFNLENRLGNCCQRSWLDISDISRRDMPNSMTEKMMYGFLSISVGIDFDDNGKNKEKKHIMRHLKKRNILFQITQP